MICEKADETAEEPKKGDTVWWRSHRRKLQLLLVNTGMQEDVARLPACSFHSVAIKQVGGLVHGKGKKVRNALQRGLCAP